MIEVRGVRWIEHNPDGSSRDRWLYGEPVLVDQRQIVAVERKDEEAVLLFQSGFRLQVRHTAKAISLMLGWEWS